MVPIQTDTPSYTTLLNKVELYATHILVNELPDAIVYHDIRHTLRLISNAKKIGEDYDLSEEEMELLLIVCWFLNTGLRDNYLHGHKISKAIAIEFLGDQNYPAEKIRKLAKTFDNIIWDGELMPVPTNKIEEVINDALAADICDPKKAEGQLRLIYEELLLNYTQQELGKTSWYSIVIDLLNKYRLYTPYGKEHLSPVLVEIKKQLEESRKELHKQADKVLKKELNISKEELKRLRKQLSNISKRNERSVTNLFRIITKNQYSLLGLVDRKARILVAVNAIILSILIGDVIGHDGRVIKFIPIAIMVIASLVSVIYAILSIRPAFTHGTFTEDEIRDKGGNLLYFGNYHGMSSKDFEWAFLQLLNDNNYLHSSLIRDLYYHGQELQQKYKLIRTSLNVFLFGVVFTVIAFLYVQIRLLT